MQEYDFEIRHIRGVTNCVVDGLSRSPLVDSTDGFSSTEVICTFVSKFNLPTGLEQTELRFQQKVDPQLGPIFSLQCKNKAKFSKHFCTQNGVLYRKIKNDFAMCIPNTLRNTVLYFCHDVPAAGHMGVEKTLARVRQRYGGPESQLMFVNMFFHVFIVSFISTKPVSHLACCNRYHLHQTALSQS